MEVEKIIQRLKIHFNVDKDKELANCLNINPSTLSMWRKRNAIDLNLLMKKVSGINFDEMILGEQKEKSNQLNDISNEYSLKFSEFELLKRENERLKDELKKIDTSEGSDNRIISDIQKQLKNQNDEIANLRGQLSVLLELIKSALVPKKS